MRLVALLGVGVLPLPLGLLLLEARQPLPRLRVETLGVDVVARLVVLGLHPVLGRVERLAFADKGAGVVRLLEGEADPAPVEVDVDDLDEDLVADVHDLLGDLHVPFGQLGDVHQTLDALVHPDERAEGHELGDPTRDDLTDRVGTGELTPRVFLRGLERQRHPLALQVDVEHLDRDLLADLHDLRGVVDVLPGELGHVHQTVDTTKVDERPEVDDGADDALADLALGQLREELRPDLALGLLQPRAPGQNHVVPVLVQLDDLGFEFAADVGLQIAHPAHLHQRRRQEAPQPDVKDETALDDLDDGAVDDAVLLLELLDRAPGALVLRALLGQDETALLVLLLENKGLYVITDRHDLVRVDIVLDRKLPRGDHAFGLVTDVEEHLIAVHLDDGSVDDVTVVEEFDRFIDGGEEVLSRADVVDRDLRGGRGGRCGHGLHGSYVGGARQGVGSGYRVRRMHEGPDRTAGTEGQGPCKTNTVGTDSDARADLLGLRSTDSRARPKSRDRCPGWSTPWRVNLVPRRGEPRRRRPANPMGPRPCHIIGTG